MDQHPRRGRYNQSWQARLRLATDTSWRMTAVQLFPKFVASSVGASSSAIGTTLILTSRPL